MNVPAMMRIVSASRFHSLPRFPLPATNDSHVQRPGRSDFRLAPRPSAPYPTPTNPNRCFPTAPHERRERLRLLRIVERGDRFPARVLHHLMIAQQIADTQRRQPGLPGPEEIAGPAQLQVALRDFETVGGVRQRFQPLAPLFAERRLIKQDAVRLVRTASDAAAQLVQLGQAESLRVLHDHHRRVRHVHADLDDRRRDEDVQLASRECTHDAVLFVLLHAAVQ